MSITKRETKSGVVYDVVEYSGFTINGKRDRICVTCKTLKTARLEQARIIAQREALRNRSGRITFGGYVQGYYLRTLDNLAATSRDTYIRELNKRLLPMFSEMDIRDISRPHIQKLIDSCATYAVANKSLGLLKTILNQAIADGLLTTNPAAIRYPMPPKGKKRDNGLVITTFDAMRPILDAVDEYNDNTIEILVVTGLLLGLRPEERYGLNWSDFDFCNKTLSIKRAYVSVSAAEGANNIKEPKTEQSKRTIPLNEEAYTRLYRISNSSIDSKHDVVLVGRNNRRLSPSSGRKKWDRFLIHNPHLPQITLENMRHSFATSYLSAGGNVETLSKILGHSDINTTYRRYVKPDMNNMQNEMNRIFSNSTS